MKLVGGILVREAPDRDAPRRTAGGFYRTAENAGMTLGGVPLVDAQDAVVAAVRMAYRVAEAQIERSNRLAQRLRTAGDQAVGPDSGRQAVDATEKLLFNAAMSGLGWLENVAAEGDSPIKRLLATQYRMLGTMLGIVDPSSDAPPDRAGRRAERRGAPPDAGSDTRTSRQQATAPPSSLRIVHRSERGRAVRVTDWVLTVHNELRAPVTFYPQTPGDDQVISAEFTVTADAVATLRVGVEAGIHPGRWRGAICDESQLQVGWIEIEV